MIRYKWGTRKKVRCTTCSKVMFILMYRAKIHKLFYCNKKCFKKSCSIRYAGNKNPNTKPKNRILCYKCKKVLYLQPSLVNKNGINFCNRKCKAEWQKKHFIGKNNPCYRGGKKLKCNFCNNLVYRNPFKMKNRSLCFCNKKCMGKWYHKNKSGKNSHSYIDGRSSLPYTSEFNYIIKEKIIKRDKYICQLCGITQKEHFKIYGDNLYIHHIDYNKNHANTKKLITLCCSCNTKVNTNRKLWEQYFKIKISNG